MCTLLWAQPAGALDPDKPLHACTAQSWRVREGMPGSWVRSILQSHEGYLWIATYGGVARYDGERLEQLETSGALHRVFDTLSLKHLPGGGIQLVSSVGAPACLLDSGLTECHPDGLGLPDRTRLVDAHPRVDGVSWLASRTAFYRHVRGAGPAVPVPLPLPNLGEFRNNFVHEDRRGRLWLGTTDGLLVASGGRIGGRPERQPLPHLQFHVGPDGPVRGNVTSYFESTAGHLWFATDAGLLRVEGDQTWLFGAAEGWPDTRPSQVIEDRDGNVWIGTATGLLRLQGGQLTRVDHGNALPDEEVTTLYEDREGSLWVGSRSGGLVQFTDRTVQSSAGPPSLRRDQEVESLTQDAAGALWFGWRHGLVRYHQGVERTFTTRDGLPSDHVLAVARGNDGEVWVGTALGLMRVRDGRLDRPVDIVGRVEALLVDSDRSLLLTVDGKLARLPEKAAAGAPLRLQVYPVDTGFPLGYVRGMKRDGQGRLWVSGVVGVGRLQNDRVVDAGLPRALRTARGMHVDGRGRLWIAAGAGLVRVLADGRMQLFGPAQGLGNRELFQVVTDGQGFVWVGTSRGILRLPERQLDDVAAGRQPRVHFLSLDTTDRRQDVVASNVRQPGALLDDEGRLWFASEQGALTIDPQRLRLNARPPTVRIASGLIDGRPLVRGQDNSVPPGPGNVEFRFSTVTLLEPHKSLHRYRLEGFDKDWVEARARRVAYYTNIPAGRYHFRVQGANADGVWNQEGDRLSFQLRPHFYRTAWFYALLTALLLAATTLLWRLRVRSLRRQYLAAFAERSKVARELHDTLLQGMSAVGLQLRGLRRRLSREAPGAARELASLEETITTSLQETRRFLSDLREQPGSAADLGVALERLAGRLAEGRDLRCTVTVEGTPVPLPHDTTGDLFRIAQEAVTNALAHASARHIDVRLQYQPGEVILTVRDDGQGFDPAAARGAGQGHFGLLGMQERGARLAGYTLESQPGAGTTVRAVVRPGRARPG